MILDLFGNSIESEKINTNGVLKRRYGEQGDQEIILVDRVGMFSMQISVETEGVEVAFKILHSLDGESFTNLDSNARTFNVDSTDSIIIQTSQLSRFIRLTWEATTGYGVPITDVFVQFVVVAWGEL